MEAETAYVIDFDGTVTTRDITTELGLFFGGSQFMEIDKSYQAKQIPIKSWLQAEVALLPVDLDKLKNKAFEWAEIRPGFETFLQKAQALNHLVIIGGLNSDVLFLIIKSDQILITSFNGEGLRFFILCNLMPIGI